MWPWTDQHGPCPMECIVRRMADIKITTSETSVVKREAQDTVGACVGRTCHMLSCVRETPHGSCEFCSFTKNAVSVGTIPKRMLPMFTTRLFTHCQHRVNVVS